MNELELVAKSRGIKGYKRLSKEKLVSTPTESESVESVTPLSKKSFDDERLKKIRKDFNELRDRFSKSQIKEIWKNLYDIKNQKNLSKKKKEIEESLFKLEESFSNFKKYHFQDDFKYRNIGDIRNLFNGVALNDIAFSQSVNWWKLLQTNKNQKCF